MGVDGPFRGPKNGSLLGFAKLAEMGNDLAVEMILASKRYISSQAVRPPKLS